MVKPLWKTTRCQACRDRKVKCERDGPACNRCLIAGIECVDIYPPGQFVRPSTHPKSKSTSAPIREVLEISPRSRYATPQQPRQITFPLSPFAGQHEQQALVSSLVYEYTPKSPGRPVIPLQTFSWFLCLSEQHGKSFVLDQALSALALIFLGTKSMDNGAIYASMECHDRLVREIRNLKYSSEELITAVTAMCMYEVFNHLHHPNSWMTHVRAACHLLEQQGPQIPMDPRLMCLIRTLAFYDCCGRRKSTMFTHPGWREIVPRDEPFEHVLDTVMFVCTVQELSDCIRSPHIYDGNAICQATNLFLSIFTMTYQQLRQSYLDFLNLQGGYPFEVRPASPQELRFFRNNPELLGVFPEVIRFRDYFSFQLSLLFWHGFHVLYAEAFTVMQYLQDNLAYATPPPQVTNSAHKTSPWFQSELERTKWPFQAGCDFATALADTQRQAEDFAVSICKVVGCCDQYSYGSIMTLPLVSPLWLVQQFFKDRSRERWLWCQTVLQCFQAKIGTVIAPLTWKAYKELDNGDNGLESTY